MRVRLTSNGKNARITVQDSGPGIAVEDQPRIFDRFERATCSKHVSGLGLGLYIARGIVMAHRGEILLESTPGEGSEFILHLPLNPSGSEAKAD